jgi:hypothetical protein
MEARILSDVLPGSPGLSLTTPRFADKFLQIGSWTWEVQFINQLVSCCSVYWCISNCSVATRVRPRVWSLSQTLMNSLFWVVTLCWETCRLHLQGRSYFCNRYISYPSMFSIYRSYLVLRTNGGIVLKLSRVFFLLISIYITFYRASILFGYDRPFSWQPVRPSPPTFPVPRVQTKC